MRRRSVTGIAAGILREYTICERCLGRCFGLLSTGLPNEVRGRSIITTLLLELSRRSIESGRKVRLLEKLRREYTPDGRLKSPQKCFICRGVTKELGRVAKRVADALAEYEFSSFRVGVTVPSKLIEAEDEVRRRFSVSFGESIKSELSREIGKEVSRLTGAPASKHPDIDVTCDLTNQSVKVTPHPIYLRGSYVKLDSTLGGAAVGEVIGGTAAEFYRARGFKLHTAGMEVKGLKVLGFGREFVLELIRPAKRFVEPNLVREAINERAAGQLYVRNLNFAERKAVSAVKRPERTIMGYLVLAKGGEISEEELARAESVRKVAVRRGTRKTERRIFNVKIKKWGDAVLVFLRCQGGVNPKKFVGGDPSYEPSLGDLFGGKLSYLEHIVIEARGNYAVK